MCIFFIYIPPIIYEEKAIRVKYFLHIVTIFYKKKGPIGKELKRWTLIGYNTIIGTSREWVYIIRI